jgi:hypothetical protein
MIRLAIIVVAVIGLLVAFSVPAGAWTREDCIRVGFNHPDCAKFKPTPAPTSRSTPVRTPVRTVSPPAPRDDSLRPPTPVRIIVPSLPSTSTVGSDR